MRWIICLNTAEAVKDKTTRDEAVTRLEAELARISDARAKASTALKTASSVKSGHGWRPSWPAHPHRVRPA